MPAEHILTDYSISIYSKNLITSKAWDALHSDGNHSLLLLLLRLLLLSPPLSRYNVRKLRYTKTAK